ncbi:hypothetical protein NDN08_000666 [Rhodosorus marinus]|uniref:C2H2-type domain-containing protein n=1 Tax=Rhodosorus marinus TaxID=101924 RepID=A0AAV8UNU2_9RHOD|nr:hypothetical protein NDN08_000666 [Rhodosorus marinus]
MLVTDRSGGTTVSSARMCFLWDGSAPEQMDVRSLLTSDTTDEEKCTFEVVRSLRSGNEQEPGVLYGVQGGQMGLTYLVEKPFFCGRCLRAFTTKKSLRVHENTVHLGMRQYECKVCGRHFGTRSSMKRHISHKHGENEQRTSSKSPSKG